METETAGYQSAETWKSSAVSWFVNHIGAGREKLTEKVGASLDRVQAWPESLMQSRPVVKKKSRRHEFEQVELWPEDQPVKDESAVQTAPVAEQTATSEEQVPFVKVASLRASKLAAAKARDRMASRRTAPVTRTAPAIRRDLQGSHIVRFLNVNGAIEGMRTGGIRFDLPGRGFSQALRLWTGSNNDEHYTVARF